jgi:hypothetical protein
MGRRVLVLVLFICASGALLSCGSDSSNGEDTGTSATQAATASTRQSTTSTRQRTTTSGEQDGLPTTDQIQRDLIGKSITDPHLGRWDFESVSEFEDFTIVSQKETDDGLELEVDMRLKDINDGKLYNSAATITYTKVGGQWRLEDVTGEFRSAQPSI